MEVEGARGPLERAVAAFKPDLRSDAPCRFEIER